jgi:hypothetical protein
MILFAILLFVLSMNLNDMIKKSESEIVRAQNLFLQSINTAVLTLGSCETPPASLGFCDDTANLNNILARCVFKEDSRETVVGEKGGDDVKVECEAMELIQSSTQHALENPIQNLSEDEIVGMRMVRSSSMRHSRRMWRFYHASI